MKEAQITGLFNKNDVLHICQRPDGTLSVNTVRVDGDDFQVGKETPLTAQQGTIGLKEFHKPLASALPLETVLNRPDPVNRRKADLTRFEAVEIAAPLADQSRLTVYRQEAGYIGISTNHAEKPDQQGPVVWVSGPVNKYSSPAMQKRAEIFGSLFDLAKTAVATSANKPSL